MIIVEKKIKEITITYDPGEKLKAIEYCYDKGYDIKDILDSGVIVATKEGM